MVRVLAGMCAGVILSDVAAADTPWYAPTWSGDIRARYELASNAASPNDGRAATLRVRLASEFALSGRFSALGEVEGIIDGLPKSENGFGRAGNRPAIADQETLEVNRLQLAFAPTDSAGFIAGRQRISLDDERFIGTVNFRQNQQTYDAVTTTLRLPGALLVDAGYIWQVNRVLGPRRPDGVFSGDVVFLNANAPTPLGRLSLFHYDADLDRAGADTAPFDRATTGAFLDGRTYAGDWSVLWQLGYAAQDDTVAGETHDYILADVGVEAERFSLSARYELLGGGRASAFQTPLATLHKFQGEADVFLETPLEGVEDLSLRAVWRLGSIWGLRGVTASLTAHDFGADLGGGTLGQEIDGSLAATYRGIRYSVAVAHYEAGSFASDQTRGWFTASRSF